MTSAKRFSARAGSANAIATMARSAAAAAFHRRRRAPSDAVQRAMELLGGSTRDRRTLPGRQMFGRGRPRPRRRREAHDCAFSVLREDEAYLLVNGRDGFGPRASGHGGLRLP